MDGDGGPVDRLVGDDDAGDDDGDDGDEWRFSVAEVGPDADEGAGDAAAVGPERPPIEPESVSPEHAAFVLAGAVLTLVVILNAV